MLYALKGRLGFLGSSSFPELALVCAFLALDLTFFACLLFFLDFFDAVVFSLFLLVGILRGAPVAANVFPGASNMDDWLIPAAPSMEGSLPPIILVVLPRPEPPLYFLWNLLKFDIASSSWPFISKSIMRWRSRKDFLGFGLRGEYA